jgi:hypothetical protein
VVATLRIVIGVVSLLLLVSGLAVLALGGVAGISGLWLMVLGAAGLIAVAFERTRYRSEADERSWDPAGGADEAPLDPRFRATEERFVDPTTRRRLRVWSDASTGERRYRLDE